MSPARKLFSQAASSRFTALSALLMVAQLAMAAPDWAAVEGNLQWPTNFFARRDALLAKFPIERALNVRDFGAKGDGVKDDSKAVQKALRAAFAEQRALRFPAGTYLIGTLADLQPHAFLSIGYEGKPGSLVLVGEGNARLWTTLKPPPSENPYPTSPILRIFAGATNLLVQGLAFDRSGTPPFHDPAGRPLGNGDQAGGLQLVLGRGQRGFEYIGLIDCEFVNCHHAFSLYPAQMSLNRNPWTAFPTNAFNVVHIANSRFNYTNQIGGTATWFDGVRLLVVESNRFDGLLSDQLQRRPKLTHEAFNRTPDGLLCGQCEQLWARGNDIRDGSYEMLAYTFGYRLYERDRVYAPGECVVFANDLWRRQSGGGKKSVTPGASPGWQRIATNFNARFIHRFLENNVTGAPTPGASVPGAYVGLRADLTSLVAVSNRFDRLLEGIRQCARPLGLESGMGVVSAGSVIRGNIFTDCAHGIIMDNGPSLVVENDFAFASDAPREINGQFWHPMILCITDCANGTLARANSIRLASRQASSSAPDRKWNPWPNAAVAFIAGDGVHGCAEANVISNFACGVTQHPWHGFWTLRSNLWSNVTTPWEGAATNVIADETIPLTTPAPGWFTVANLERSKPSSGSLELTTNAEGKQVRYRIELNLAAPATESRLRVTTTDAGEPGQRLLEAVFCRDDGALMLRFGRTNPVPATLRFTTASPDDKGADSYAKADTGICWKWPFSSGKHDSTGWLGLITPAGVLQLTNGVIEAPIFR